MLMMWLDEGWAWALRWRDGSHQKANQSKSMQFDRSSKAPIADAGSWARSLVSLILPRSSTLVSENDYGVNAAANYAAVRRAYVHRRLCVFRFASDVTVYVFASAFFFFDIHCSHRLSQLGIASRKFAVNPMQWWGSAHVVVRCAPKCTN